MARTHLLSTAIRESIWAYPIVESVHVLTIAVFLGLTAAMDAVMVNGEGIVLGACSEHAPSNLQKLLRLEPGSAGASVDGVHRMFAALGWLLRGAALVG